MKDKRFIYIRGLPGTGKITVARILRKKLKYHLFWFHDIKNSVYKVVKEHRIPELMDDTTLPILKYLLTRSKPIIYVRPSSTPRGIDKVKSLVKKYGYQFDVVTLSTSYDQLLKRISKRRGNDRVSNKKDLDQYISDKKISFSNYKMIGINIDTTRLKPEQVADKIIKKLKLN